MLRYLPPIAPKVAEPRGTDRWGQGHFGAPRGDRKHEGVDYEMPVGSAVLALTAGRVTRTGYAYADDMSYRYVEVTDQHKYRLRYFYVAPTVKIADNVLPGDPLGRLQDLGRRYVGITPHVHFEVYEPGGGRLDPAEYARRFNLTGEPA